METLADFKKCGSLEWQSRLKGLQLPQPRHLRRTYGSYLRAWLLVPRLECSVVIDS